ncbi:hypothetical protein Pfo_014311 [Paulownia fortunei]|nr:hypothetical protein Pfo_014311 [Paulownia fortunei]
MVFDELGFKQTLWLTSILKLHLCNYCKFVDQTSDSSCTGCCYHCVLLVSGSLLCFLCSCPWRPNLGICSVIYRLPCGSGATRLIPSEDVFEYFKY